MSELRWEQFGKTSVCLDGERLVGVVNVPGRDEGAPCEMYQCSLFSNSFTTLEAAKADCEKGYREMAAHEKRIEAQGEQPSFGDTLLSVLKQLVTSLESAKEKRAA